MYRYRSIFVGISVLLLSLFMASCSQESTSGNLSMTGSDRDGHGCIASAGYSWCPRTEKCERSWELAEQEGIENTQHAFDAYCASRTNTSDN